MEDLWPDFGKMPPQKSPIAIIKEQASKLQEKTNYIVSAEIEKDDDIKQITIYESGKVKGFERPPFQYIFYLEAKALNYRYKLLRLSHDIFLNAY